MKAPNLRELSSDELAHRLDELYQELFNLRFQLATKQLTDTSRVRQVRKDIARIKTLLRETEIGAEVQ
jgi:large subunit ribosomal protein L29